jgi:hypothetical protein
VTGDTTARGYGWSHQQVRARWAPLVAAGQAFCADCGGWIPPGAAWDMGHREDRSGWTGPEHRRCNRAKGARKRNAMALLRAEALQATWRRW